MIQGQERCQTGDTWKGSRNADLTTFFGSNLMAIRLICAGSSGGWSGLAGRKSEKGRRTCSSGYPNVSNNPCKGHGDIMTNS
jgi:hypothetical protein